ncbi:cytochrome c oxidase subunit 3 [Benzoatithermus flavus]|uniref:Cytochrome c oxidase subunit 3 n=1 Tax=Benzoatithermus flavus TaxID=3108223 RepID=A0ABU8XR23_9PROT
MSVTLLFLLGVGAIIAWWLSQQGLATKPWLEEGAPADLAGAGAPSLPAAKLGLGVLLAVAGSLFALFISAYHMRMHMGDWSAPPVPRLLWLNTGVLVASSAALQWSLVAARRERIDETRTGLLAGGSLALAFLAGQLLAWRQLVAAGYFLAANPANSFFYLVTAVHGLHVLGGLVALGVTTTRAWRHDEAGKVRLSVDLCALYWHFLLVVWLALFVLLLS